MTCGFIASLEINNSVTHVTLRGVSAGHRHGRQAITLLSYYYALTRSCPTGYTDWAPHGTPRTPYDWGETILVHSATLYDVPGTRHHAHYPLSRKIASSFNTRTLSRLG